MDFPQLLGWLGNTLFIYGVFAIRKKHISSLYANGLANILYVWQSIILDNGSLLWISIILIILNIWAIWTWNNDAKN